jgi:cytochrome c
MMKISFGTIIAPFTIFLLVASSAHAQGYGIGTPAEAKKMVGQAVAYVLANGEERALKEFSAPNGKFQWRDLYAFAYDLNGVVMGHPNPKLIGRNLYLEPDSNGKLFRKEIVDLANMRGSGWVDYTYLDPLTGQDEFKITHFQKVGNLIVCCGAYLP